MNYDYNTTPQKIISFCTGYGGIELGLKRVGCNAQPVAYVERDGYVCENLLTKIEAGKMGPAPIFTDVKIFPGRYFSNKVHGLIGGYPCQPFSSAGKRKGTQDPRHLWPYILKHIRTIKPVWCFFENVRGHLSLGFDQVQKDLQNAGYIVEPGLFTAAEVGASHKRERLFILAHSNSIRLRGFGGEKNNTDINGIQQDKQQRREVRGETQGCSQLVNANSQRLQGSFRVQEPERLAENGQLGNANNDGLPATKVRDGSIERNDRAAARKVATGESTRSDSECKKLANANGKRLQRHEFSKRDVQEGWQKSQRPVAKCRFPARPGDQQYDWENRRAYLPFKTYSLLKSYIEKYKTCITERQADEMAYAQDLYENQPKMGGADDGDTGWVDEIRACGNGVVPDTAALAWVTLWERIGLKQ